MIMIVLMYFFEDKDEKNVLEYVDTYAFFFGNFQLFLSLFIANKGTEIFLIRWMKSPEEIHLLFWGENNNVL
jgi:hypothetical protein